LRAGVAGEDALLLGRADIEAFLHRLAFQQSRDEITPYTQRKICDELRFVLDQMKALGLSRPFLLGGHRILAEFGFALGFSVLIDGRVSAAAD